MPRRTCCTYIERRKTRTQSSECSKIIDLPLLLDLFLIRFVRAALLPALIQVTAPADVP
jgi:hypothetical protein